MAPPPSGEGREGTSSRFERTRSNKPQARRRRALIRRDRLASRCVPARRRPRLPDGRVADGRVHSRHDPHRDACAHPGDGAQRRGARPRRDRRHQGRQALDRRSRRQGDADRGPAGGCVRRKVPKLSGRALAHTGGTLDKLESVPGLTVDLDPARFIKQVSEVGIAVAAQSPHMVPADKALYALRDVTGTVPSIPLIASSVMSKKIAAGADAIVLDVKFGRGAFMRDVPSAEALSKEMVQLGEGAGRHTVALVTAMDNPLGRSIGNALEVQEALDALAGKGDEELIEVSLTVAREMCKLAEVDKDPTDAVKSGAGRQMFVRMLEAQGGNLDAGLPVAPVQIALVAAGDGYVESIDALAVGLASLDLGAGRHKKEDKVDPAAGLVIQAPVGTHVAAGDPLVVVHARSADLVEKVKPRLLQAWKLVAHEVQRPPHVLARVDKHGTT